MSYLFIIEHKKVIPNPEILLIHPFKELWERDLSIGKENALEEFAYIEFMTSMHKSNPYRQYPDNKKEEVIRNEIITQDNWNPDELVIEGMKKIEEFQTEGSLAYQYWLSNKIAIEKMIDFFNEVDVNERNMKTGNPIYKPKDITSAVSDAEKMLITINGLLVKVEEEQFEKQKTKSDKVISPFANPNSLKK